MSDDSGKRRTGNVQVTLATDLDEALSRAAGAYFTDRSEITRRALVEYLRQHGFIPLVALAEGA